MKPVTPPQTRRLIRWSLGLGLAGFVTALAGVGVFLALAAIVCAGIALVRLRPWHSHDGHAMALCGLIAGIAALLSFPVWMVVVVPRLVTAHDEYQARQCRKNLLAIATAKEQWAADHQATNGSVVPEQIIITRGKPFRCPAGGRYRINPVGVSPACTISWHNTR